MAFVKLSRTCVPTRNILSKAFVWLIDGLCGVIVWILVCLLTGCVVLSCGFLLHLRTVCIANSMFLLSRGVREAE